MHREGESDEEGSVTIRFEVEVLKLIGSEPELLRPHTPGGNKSAHTPGPLPVAVILNSQQYDDLP